MKGWLVRIREPKLGGHGGEDVKDAGADVGKNLICATLLATCGAEPLGVGGRAGCPPNHTLQLHSPLLLSPRT
jgi:hypothetical protein